MRNIDQDVIDACQASVRSINARVKIQDDRLLFASYANAIDADIFLAKGNPTENVEGWYNHRATISPNGGILRAALRLDDSVGTAGLLKLAVQYIADPTAEWPDWEYLDPLIEIKQIYPPEYDVSLGLHGNNIFIKQNTSSNTFKRLTYNPADGSYTSTNCVCQYLTSPHCATMPVSDTEMYICQTTPIGTRQAFFLAYVTTTIGVNQYEKYLPTIMVEPEDFDPRSVCAVRHDGVDYIYISADNGTKAFCITAIAGGAWSDPIDLFPLDYTDDTAKFLVGNATSIDGKIIVNGTLTRSSSGDPLQIYTIGPDHYTIGRDMYIDYRGGDDFVATIDSEQETFRDGQGCLVAHGDYLYHILPGGTSRALLPEWLGGTSPSWTYSCNNIQLMHDATGASTLALEVPSDISSSIKAGMTLILEPSVIEPEDSDNFFQFGVYEIDVIQTPKTATGKGKSIVARPRGIKRLAQWRSDASYDYWSQSFRDCDASDQRYLIRGHGLMTDPSDGKSIVPKGNELGWAWSSESPEGTHVVRAKVVIAPGTETFVAGVIANLYTETAIEAAYRLVIDPSDIKDDYILTTGLALVYSSEDQKFSIREFRSDANAQSGADAFTLIAESYDDYDLHDDPVYDQWYYLTLVYSYGRIVAYLDNEYIRFNVGGEPISHGEGVHIPVIGREDGRGRAGVFIFPNPSIATVNYMTAYALNLSTLDNIDGSTYYFDPPIVYQGLSYSSAVTRNGAGELSKNRYHNGSLRPGGETNPFAVMPTLWFSDDAVFKTARIWSNPNKASIPLRGWARWLYLDLGMGVVSTLTSPLALQGCIARVISGNKAGLTWEIEYWDYLAPLYWYPTIKSPDPAVSIAFQNVGDPAYGSWHYYKTFWRNPTADLWQEITSVSVPVRINYPSFVSSPDTAMIPEPYNTLGERSYVEILPSVRFVITNNWMNRNAIFSSGQLVSAAPGTTLPRIENVVTATGNRDMSFAWMATEICRKAGVLDVSVEDEITSQIITSSGWINALNEAVQTERSGSAIVELKIPSNGSVGIVGASDGGDLGGNWNGYLIYIQNTTGSAPVVACRQIVNGALGNLTYYPLMYDISSGETATGKWATISITNDKAAVWTSDNLVAVFSISLDLRSVSVVSLEPRTVEVEWKKLDMRVDNFVLDINQTGMDLLRRLIKRKRIRFLDDSTGGIKLFRDGAAINTAQTPYTMKVISTDTDTDVNRITRIRMEGVEIYETADPAQLAEYGNVFALENFDELEYIEQFTEEGDLYLADVERSSRVRIYRGPADPRVEPWDEIWIDDDGSVYQVIVKAVKFVLSISEDSAVFDMEIEAEKKNA